MNKAIQLVGISGSLRKGSFNTMLLKAAASLLPAHVSVELLSFADLPVYNADIDIPAQQSRPGSVNQFREKIAKADGIIISSPEYNYSIPGGLKNAVDWASRGDDAPMIGKHVSLMGATTGKWGTARMQLAFLPVFNTLKMQHLNKFEVFVSMAESKFDKDGNLTDADTREILKKHLEYFLATMSG
ncbi:MAG TPA: NAD(P)H-dependent oxidoreductase [Ferruginibacter sp.]|jgi:chromate reductase|nr:NAD(P)H-dependent oxidoreductase [Ferruginibacter sp.]